MSGPAAQVLRKCY